MVLDGSSEALERVLWTKIPASMPDNHSTLSSSLLEVIDQILLTQI